MVIKLIKNNVLWDSFVDSSPYGTLFHKWSFLEIVSKYSNLKLYRYGIYKEETLLAIFPFFYGKKKFLNTLFSPPPNVAIPHLGFIMDKEFLSLKQDKKESFFKEIVNSINEIIRKYPSDYLYISLVPGLIDVREFIWSGFIIKPQYTYYLSLTDDNDEILMRFEHKTRNVIKNSQNKKFYIKKSDDLSNLFSRQNQRYAEQKLNYPIQDINYLLDIKNKFPENLICYLFCLNDKILSSSLIIEYKKAIGWLGFAKPDEYSNDIFIWEIIKNEKQNGYDLFELAGANTKKLLRFKSQFNPSLHLFFSIEKENIFGKISKYIYINLVKKRF